MFRGAEHLKAEPPITVAPAEGGDSGAFFMPLASVGPPRMRALRLQ